MEKKFYIIIALFLVLVSNSFSGQYFPIPNGWIDPNGEVIPCENCDSTFFAHSDIGIYERGKKQFIFDFIEKKSRVNDFDEINPFNGHFSTAKDSIGWHVINAKGEIIKNINCHYAYSFYNGLARIQLGNKFGYIDSTGSIKTSIKYSGAGNYSEGLARVHNGEKWGFIDLEGIYKIKPQYDYAWDFKNENAVVANQNNYVIIDQNNNQLTKPYDFIMPTENGFSICRKGSYHSGKLLLVNIDQKTEATISFEDAYPFCNGLSCVFDRTSKKWGYINAKLEMILECQFDSPVNFNHGIALVRKNGQHMYINNNGKTIWTKAEKQNK